MMQQQRNSILQINIEKHSFSNYTHNKVVNKRKIKKYQQKIMTTKENYKKNS